MKETHAYYECPKCKAKDSVRLTQHENDRGGVTLSLKRCSKCRYDAGIKEIWKNEQQYA